MFTVEMLPAQQGDALWIEYGTPPDVHRVLIDGGTPPTAQVIAERIHRLPPTERTFELLIVTHIDTDHIGGVLRLLADLPDGVSFRDVWFNDWAVLPPCPQPQRGPIDGAILTGILGGRTRNAAFGGAAVAVPAEGDLPPVTLPGGLRLTVLSPMTTELGRLSCVWQRVLRDAGLDPAAPAPDRLAEKARRKGVAIPRSLRVRDVDALADSAFTPDRARANGTSIAVLAEYAGRSCLLTGDAYATVLTDSLIRLRRTRELRLDAIKVPHHGSRRNVSLPLVAAARCRAYLFSSDGSIFGHPDPEAVARVVRDGGPGTTLLFNYANPALGTWDQPELRERYGYEVRRPGPGESGMVLDLSEEVRTG